jgi:DNA primase
VVIVTEGEYKADQLAALGLLVTTSGAADSAGDADWQALAGRDVLIWPDNDAPGRHYADAVLAALRCIGLQVKVIDVDLLGLPPKGDAVDWLASHPEAKAADVLGPGL